MVLHDRVWESSTVPDYFYLGSFALIRGFFLRCWVGDGKLEVAGSVWGGHRGLEPMPCCGKFKFECSPVTGANAVLRQVLLIRSPWNWLDGRRFLRCGKELSVRRELEIRPW